MDKWSWYVRPTEAGTYRWSSVSCFDALYFSDPA
jgi:hypothetical protein